MAFPSRANRETNSTPCGDKSHTHTDPETERLARRYCTADKLTVPRAGGKITTVHQRSMSWSTLAQTSSPAKSSGDGWARPEAKLDEKTYLLIDKMAKRATARDARTARFVEKDIRDMAVAQPSLGKIARMSDMPKAPAGTFEVCPTTIISKCVAVSAGDSIRVAEAGQARTVQVSQAKPVIKKVTAEDAWEMVDESALDEEQWDENGDAPQIGNFTEVHVFNYLKEELDLRTKKYESSGWTQLQEHVRKHAENRDLRLIQYPSEPDNELTGDSKGRGL